MPYKYIYQFFYLSYKIPSYIFSCVLLECYALNTIFNMACGSVQLQGKSFRQVQFSPALLVGMMLVHVQVIVASCLVSACGWIRTQHMRECCQTSSIRCTLVDNKIVDHSDLVRTLPVSAAPTTSSCSTKQLALVDSTKTTARQGKKHLSFVIWCDLY